MLGELINFLIILFDSFNDLSGHFVKEVIPYVLSLEE